jgi:hypothetical protein
MSLRWGATIADCGHQYWIIDRSTPWSNPAQVQIISGLIFKNYQVGISVVPTTSEMLSYPSNQLLAYHFKQVTLMPHQYQILHQYHFAHNSSPSIFKLPWFKDICVYIYTGCFIMFSVITNIYNKKTKGTTLIELFTATGKLKKKYFDN